jgi:hypothetical protein
MNNEVSRGIATGPLYIGAVQRLQDTGNLGEEGNSNGSKIGDPGSTQ